MTKRYEVQEATICDGWTNTWHEYDDDNNEVLMTFDSFAQAVEELDEHLYDMEKAYNMGDISSLDDRNNFRIVEVKND